MVSYDKWHDAACELDEEIHKKLGSMSDTLPKQIKVLPSFGNFLEHLMYIIMSFLNEDSREESPQELFIQIPVEEFANLNGGRNGDKLQVETYKAATGAIATCLYLSSVKRVCDELCDYKEKVLEGKINNGQQFFATHPREGDVILYSIKRSDWPQICSDYFNKRKGEDKITLTDTKVSDPDTVILYYKKKNASNYIVPQKVNDKFIRDCTSIYRITNVDRPNIKEIKQDLNLVNLTKHFADKVRQYSKVALVHIGNYPPVNENIPIASRYFDTVTLVNDIEKIDRKSQTEVIIVVGDKRYKDQVSAFRRRAFKKIVYVGTNLPEKDIPCYSFSFREMYRYCAPSESMCLSEPELIKDIEFPWLDETMRNLGELLKQLSENDECVNEETVCSLKRFFYSIFSSLDFSMVKWCKKQEDISAQLEQIIPSDIKEETFESIDEWASELRYSKNTNPKLEISRHISPIAFCKFEKTHWKKKIRSLVNNNNYVVLDCASNSRYGKNMVRDVAFKYILEHHLFAKITVLYYPGEINYAKRLLEFVDGDDMLSDNELRNKYNTSLRVVEEDSNSGGGISLDEIQIDDSDYYIDCDTSFADWWHSDRQVVTVKFNDGRSANIDGDVLQTLPDGSLKQIAITELEEEDFDTKDIDIYYYTTPEFFDAWITAFTGVDLKAYSSLWREALIKYYTRELNNGQSEKKVLSEIEKFSRNKKTVFKKYLNKDCSQLFVRKMRAMCDFLEDQELITEEQSKKIRQAQKAHRRYPKYGKQLKKEMLLKKVGEEYNYEMIPAISKQLCIDEDEMLSKCIFHGTISNIQIKTNK